MSNVIELSRASFHDVDEFSEWEISLGRAIESTQLSAGANEVRFDHFAVPNLLVGHFCSKQSMENVFAIPNGWIVLVIPRKKLPIVLCGRHVPPTVTAIVRSGSENWTVVPAGLDCYEFMISEQLITSTGLFPPDFFAGTTRLERAFLPLMEPFTDRFVQALDVLFDLRRRNDCRKGLHDVTVPESLFRDLVTWGLQQIIDAGLKARGWHVPRSIRRPDLVEKGRDFVGANLSADISAEDVAQALGVSYRVLNYAFSGALGTSPYRYILAQKLHAVRRVLKATDRPVCKVSARYAFHTPSRFARQYARLFGELPSATRRASGHRTE